MNEAAYYDNLVKNWRVSDNLVATNLRYSTPAGQTAERLPRLKSHLIDFLGDVRGKRVLIYGCGLDCASIWFARKGAIVDAIDISPKLINLHLKMVEKACVFVNALVMDANDLHFDSDRFDIVYGNAILHHLDIGKAAKEIFRVLKPGGKAAFRDVLAGNLFLRLFRFCTPFLRTPDEHPLKKKDFKKFQNFGFKFESYILTGLPVFFFRKLIGPSSDWVYAFFDRIDRVLFKCLPFLKYQAWLCLILLYSTPETPSDKSR